MMQSNDNVNVMVFNHNDQTFILSYRDNQLNQALTALYRWWSSKLIDRFDLDAMLEHINVSGSMEE